MRRVSTILGNMAIRSMFIANLRCGEEKFICRRTLNLTVTATHRTTDSRSIVLVHMYGSNSAQSWRDDMRSYVKVRPATQCMVHAMLTSSITSWFFIIIRGIVVGSIDTTTR